MRGSGEMIHPGATSHCWKANLMTGRGGRKSPASPAAVSTSSSHIAVRADGRFRPGATAALERTGQGCGGQRPPLINRLRIPDYQHRDRSGQAALLHRPRLKRWLAGQATAALHVPKMTKQRHVSDKPTFPSFVC